MLISQKLQDAINQQIGNEFGASLEYLQIASYFEAEDMLKLSQIFFDQADEERMHAMKLLRYVLDTGGDVAGRAAAQIEEERVLREVAREAVQDLPVVFLPLELVAEEFVVLRGGEVVGSSREFVDGVEVAHPVPGAGPRAPVFIGRRMPEVQQAGNEDLRW